MEKGVGLYQLIWCGRNDQNAVVGAGCCMVADGELMTLPLSGLGTSLRRLSADRLNPVKTRAELITGVAEIS